MTAGCVTIPSSATPSGSSGGGGRVSESSDVSVADSDRGGTSLGVSISVAGTEADSSPGVGTVKTEHLTAVWSITQCMSCMLFHFPCTRFNSSCRNIRVSCLSTLRSLENSA